MHEHHVSLEMLVTISEHLEIIININKLQHSSLTSFYSVTYYVFVHPSGATIDYLYSHKMKL